MNEIKFKDIIDSLAEGYDENLREELFSKLETLETDDDALNGVKLFITKHGRDYDKMRNTFKSFSQLLESKEKRAKIISMVWVRYAAVLILVSSVAYYFYLQEHKFDLTAYEYHDAGLPVLMGNTDNVIFNNGMSAFKMKDYHKAYDAFSKCKTNDTVAFYRGMSSYEGGDYEKAFHHFTEISDTSKLYIKTLYMIGICDIRLDRKDEAIIALKILTLSENTFKKQASELLAKLEE